MIEAGSLELEPLVSPMVKLVASHNEEVKRLACNFLVLADATGKNEVGLLAANILEQDLADPNPNIRVIAVSTVCAVQGLAEHHGVKGMRTSFISENDQPIHLLFYSRDSGSTRLEPSRAKVRRDGHGEAVAPLAVNRL